MQPSECPRFLEALAGVHDFYGKEVSEFASQVWIEAVKGFELQQVTKALSAHLMDPERGQFMPKPSDLVRQLQGTQTDRSLIAWGKVSGAMGNVGAWRDVAFDDPIVHLCITDLGGWPKACRTPYDEQGYLQHSFCKAYQAYAGRGAPTEWPSFLVGSGEGREQYEAAGLPAPRIKLVGDVSTARRVVDGGMAVARLAATQAMQALPDLRKPRAA